MTDKTPYPDDFAEASSLLRLAVALLASHQFLPSPLNFRVGYDYVSGYNESTYGKIAIFIGVAQFHMSDMPNTLIQRADLDLYRAKEHGRNRVEQAA